MEKILNEELQIVTLNEEHLPRLKEFDCIRETEDLKKRNIEGKDFRTKQVKKFINHSKDINNFIYSDALEEQGLNLNTTHLLIYKEDIVGFISLCSDSIRLSASEKEDESVPYVNIPAMKIARLAIDKKYQGCSYGTVLIKFAIAKALVARKTMGIKFITVDCYKHRLSFYKNKCGFKENFAVNQGKDGDNPISLRLNIDEYLDQDYFSY